MAYGVANGGAADEAALRRLLQQEASQDRESPPGGGAPPAQLLRARARWAAANAVSMLREHRAPYEALCDALRRGESVGACALAVERAWAGGPPTGAFPPRP